MNPSLRKKILSVQPRYHQLKIPFIDSPLDPATMSPGQDAIQLHHRPWYAGRVQCLRIPANGEHIHLIDVDLSWSDQDKIITVPFIGHLWQERDHTRRFHVCAPHVYFKNKANQVLHLAYQITCRIRSFTFTWLLRHLRQRRWHVHPRKLLARASLLRGCIHF